MIYFSDSTPKKVLFNSKIFPKKEDPALTTRGGIRIIKSTNVDQYGKLMYMNGAIISVE